MNVTLICNRKELLLALKQVKLGLPKSKREQLSSTLEIDLKPGSVKLSTIGASYSLKTTSQVFAKILVPYTYFYDLVHQYHGTIFSIDFYQGKLVCGSITYESLLIQIVHPENQRPLDLPMNYGAKDLLLLRETHSVEELERLNLLKKIEDVEEDLKSNSIKASLILNQYGVTRKDIEQLIRSKLKEHL